jgi:tRNA pseudouridine55 synthase
MLPAGALLVDKPQTWTSHDVVAVVRKLFPKGTKVGHTGTLDPLATGLLVLLVGPATRLQEKLQGCDKVYSGKIRLGVATDTGDVTGKTLEEKPVPSGLTLGDLQKRMDAKVGTVEMAAPAYSAVKHQGKPLYAYARKGVAVPEKIRTTTVHEWKALSFDGKELEHRLSCSSGTYVRSLAEVLGKELGCGAAVSTLRRESVGKFELADAVTLEVLRALPAAELAALLLSSIEKLK